MNDAWSMFQRSLKLAPTTSQLIRTRGNVEGAWNETIRSSSRPPATPSAQTRHAAGVRTILECSFDGEDLHGDCQIVTKKKLLDQTLQECVRTNLRTHSVVLNVFSPMWCRTS